MIDSLTFNKLWRQIQRGINKCRTECEYFSFCGGGSPSNKFGEHQRFDVSTTKYCELHYKELIDLLTEKMEQKYSLLH